MKVVPILGAIAGLTAIALLLAWQDAGAVMDSLGSLGWGLFLLPLVWLPHLTVSTTSWRMLFIDGRAPGLLQTMRAFWVGQSVGVLLPAAGVGQPVVKVRMLMHDRFSGVDASASIVLDKTVQALSLLVWGLSGVAVLVAMHAADEIVLAALIGSGLLGAGIAGFIVVQRAGAFGFLARRLAGLSQKDHWSELAVQAGEVDATILRLYRRPARVALSCVVRLAARSLLTAEILLAAYLMGHPLTLWDAVMLRSLTAALRGAAFVVPGGLGIQEGGFIAVGAVANLSPELMLALSLATRGRELLVGVPGILAWQHAEGRALLKRFALGRQRRPTR